MGSEGKLFLQVEHVCGTAPATPGAHQVLAHPRGPARRRPGRQRYFQGCVALRRSRQMVLLFVVVLLLLFGGCGAGGARARSGGAAGDDDCSSLSSSSCLRLVSSAL